MHSVHDCHSKKEKHIAYGSRHKGRHAGMHKSNNKDDTWQI